MALARNALLWVSENRKLRETLPRYQFIRRAVSRFMPGEQLSDALRAAQTLKEKGITAILTHLGENITEASEARGVADHYLEVLERVHEHGLDSYISVKLTQLGLDLSEEMCRENLSVIIDRARAFDFWVWIDMEQSPYVDRTLAIYREARSRYRKVGVCLQSYLYRTGKDLQSLLPLSPAIRLVKGAYKEPSSLAYRKKRDVDANYFRLARLLLEGIRDKGVTLGIATHDRVLIEKVQTEANRLGLSKADYEFQLLYGIQTETQFRLAREGYRVRVLISYGTYWFPWYVRRLAERPANVFFAIKNIWSR